MDSFKAIFRSFSLETSTMSTPTSETACVQVSMLACYNSTLYHWLPTFSCKNITVQPGQAPYRVLGYQKWAYSFCIVSQCQWDLISNIWASNPIKANYRIICQRWCFLPLFFNKYLAPNGIWKWPLDHGTYYSPKNAEVVKSSVIVSFLSVWSASCALSPDR